MKKIKDLSKTIGLIRRGGLYSPSNDRSQMKWIDVFSRAGFESPPATIDDEMLPLFLDVAKKCGYTVATITRGLGR